MAEEIKEQIKIEPFTLIYDILKNWWVILMGAVTAALLMYVIMDARYVPRYSTTATFVVSSRSDSNATTNLSSAYEMAQTFETILKSSIMEKTICESLGVSYISAELHTEVIQDTNLLVLTVTDSTPRGAIDTIHAVMDNYSSISFYTVGNAVMDVLDEPEIPYYPDNPKNSEQSVKRYALYGACLVILLIGVASYMKNTLKREEDIEEKLDARSLGVIAHESKYKSVFDFLKHKGKKKALLVNSPIAGFGFVEGYHKLATRVDYQMAKEGRKTLLVTSVSENEGKSTVAANLAISLARQGKRVILIEGDLRRPSQFLIFNKKLEEKNEIGEFLKGNGKLSDILMVSGIQNLLLILGRNCYSTSTEILNSDRLEKLINNCKKYADYVIIDSPPAGMMGDAEAISRYTDAVMVVAKHHYMRAEDINDVLDSFREHHSKVLGVMLNNVRSFSELPVGGYYGGYGHYGKYGKYGKYAKR